MVPIKDDKEEEDYYYRIIACYNNACKEGKFVKFETFACREIASLLHERKQNNLSLTEKNRLETVAHNTLLLMLDFFQTNEEKKVDRVKNVNDLQQNKQEQVKDLFISILNQ